MTTLYHLQVIFKKYSDNAFIYVWYKYDRLNSLLVSCNFGVVDIKNRL